MNGIYLELKKNNIALYKIRSRKHEKELAEIFSKAKLQKGLCFREVADLTGLNITRLNNLLNAMEIISIKVDEIVALCGVFGIEISITKQGIKLT